MNQGKDNLPTKSKPVSYKKMLKQIKENKPNINNTIKKPTLVSGELSEKFEKI